MKMKTSTVVVLSIAGLGVVYVLMRGYFGQPAFAMSGTSVPRPPTPSPSSPGGAPLGNLVGVIAGWFKSATAPTSTAGTTGTITPDPSGVTSGGTDVTPGQSDGASGGPFFGLPDGYLDPSSVVFT